MSKFYADRFYKDENGNYYTGEYLINEYGTTKGYRDIKLYAKTWDDFHNEMDGKSVRCTYSQIFAPDSSMILCNNIPEQFPDIWDCIENGDCYDPEYDCYNEIFQWYIIDDNTAARLKEHTDELIFYIESLDIYVLGVTHWGTAWSHVGTDFIY